MKKFLILLSVSLLLLSGCTSDDPEFCEKQGIVISRDFSRWICGGGWFLRTEEGDTVSLYFANAYKNDLEEMSLPAAVNYTLQSLPENECGEFAFDLSCLELVIE